MDDKLEYHLLQLLKITKLRLITYTVLIVMFIILLSETLVSIKDDYAYLTGFILILLFCLVETVNALTLHKRYLFIINNHRKERGKCIQLINLQFEDKDIESQYTDETHFFENVIAVYNILNNQN